VLLFGRTVAEQPQPKAASRQAPPPTRVRCQQRFGIRKCFERFMTSTSQAKRLGSLTRLRSYGRKLKSKLGTGVRLYLRPARCRHARCEWAVYSTQCGVYATSSFDGRACEPATELLRWPGSSRRFRRRRSPSTSSHSSTSSQTAHRCHCSWCHRSARSSASHIRYRLPCCGTRCNR
jgi:hypothetical protein